jgi:ketosteroid isomerase-like protein
MSARRVLLLALGIAGGSTARLSGQTLPTRQAMAARLASYADGLKRGDHHAGDSLFTPDAQLINVFGELHGAAALDAALVQLFATATVTEATLTITAADASDTTASTAGCYTEVLSRAGQAPERHAGMYIAIWRRQSDGGWKIRRSISTEAAAC